MLSPHNPNDVAELLAALGAAPAPSPVNVKPIREFREIRVGQCVVWAGNTRHNSSGNGTLAKSMSKSGQQVAVIGRRLAGTTNRFEIIAGKRRYLVLKARNDPSVTVPVELRVMTDEEAYQLVADENTGHQAFNATEKANYYKHGLTIHGDQGALAKALDTSTSNVGRTLSILNLPDEVMQKVSNPASISARQASRFMSGWTDPDLKVRMTEYLKSLEPATAATTFDAVNDKIDPPKPENDVRSENGDLLGAIKQRRTGMTISLLPVAGNVEIDELMAAIKVTISAIHTSAA